MAASPFGGFAIRAGWDGVGWGWRETGQAEGAAWLQATRGRASPRVTAPVLAASAPSCDVVPRSGAGGPATAGGCGHYYKLMQDAL